MLNANVNTDIDISRVGNVNVNIESWPHQVAFIIEEGAVHGLPPLQTCKHWHWPEC